MVKPVANIVAVGTITIPTPEIVQAWHTEAYHHGERRSWMPSYCIILAVLSTSLTILRLTLRSRKLGGGLGLDDALLISSWVLLVAYTSVVCWSTANHTLDRHIWDVDPAKWSSVALIAWLSSLIFLVGTCLIRISVLLFYRRMVEGTFERRWKWYIWVAITFTVLWTTGLSIRLLVTCNPPEAAWKIFGPSLHQNWTCSDTRNLTRLAGALAILSDFYSLALPWIMLWSLDMPTRQKCAVNLIFSLGIVVIIASGMRTKYTIDLGRSYDTTWIGFWVDFWTSLEWNLAIICNCAPSLRTFHRFYLRDQVCSALGRCFSAHESRNKEQENMWPLENSDTRRLHIAV